MKDVTENSVQWTDWGSNHWMSWIRQSRQTFKFNKI